MIRAISIFACAAVLTGLAATHAYAETAAAELRPGLYQVTVQVNTQMGALKMPGEQDVSEECITAEDVASGPFDALPEDLQKDCETLKSEVANGQINMELKCNIMGGEGTLIGTGSYSTAAFNMKAEMKLEVQGMSMQMSADSSATRIGDC